jgi:serine O-acetyltransferase
MLSNNNLLNKIIQFDKLQNNNLELVDVVTWVESARIFLFPTLRKSCTDNSFDCMNKLQSKESELKTGLQKIFLSLDKDDSKAQTNTTFILKGLEKVFDLLVTDIQAIFEADPAALSPTTVLLCYPGFLAITYYRIANLFYNLGFPLIARIITENAHSKTGIDIHPGSKIGKSFCIDHGTGIVIGETCVIGNYVKIFQGVTLGALSVSKNQVSKQRHPIIGNNVTIYAGATILGGKTIIGNNSIIGGNTWITKSVEAGDKIYFKQI